MSATESGTIAKSLSECQDWVAAHCHRDYYAKHYRRMENDYLPCLCRVLAEIQPARSLGPAKSLEVGPGWGTMAVWLASRGWRITLADFVPPGTYLTNRFMEALQAETGQMPEYQDFDVCDKLPKPLADRPPCFDLVLMTQVLPHLKWCPLQAVKNLAAMLKPSGLAVLTALDRACYPKISPPYEYWQLVPSRGCSEPVKDMVVTMYDAADLKELLHFAFESVKVHRPTTSTCLFAECRTPRY